MALSTDERERFLAEPHVAALSVAAGPGRGPLTVPTVAGTPADLRELAERYLPADQVEEYLAMAQADHGPQLRIHLRPQRWLSADLGPV
ncbi:MAG: hypothetical protein NTW05_26145 [Pseudonocardiales bacterium]|jgi:hypothetical protein|nr:hypothetical protein [Pseudonocardiales bacterium]